MLTQSSFVGKIPRGVEPRLTEVLRDPIVHAVMARDGVTEDELRSVIRLAQRNLRAG